MSEQNSYHTRHSAPTASLSTQTQASSIHLAQARPIVEARTVTRLPVSVLKNEKNNCRSSTPERARRDRTGAIQTKGAWKEAGSKVRERGPGGKEKALGPCRCAPPATLNCALKPMVTPSHKLLLTKNSWCHCMHSLVVVIVDVCDRPRRPACRQTVGGVRIQAQRTRHQVTAL
jgi:hypothetical protein